MRKIVLIVLLLLILLSSCAYTYEWKGMYCTRNGQCEWMTGGGSQYCSASYKDYFLPFGFGAGIEYYLVEDTCIVERVLLY